MLCLGYSRLSCLYPRTRREKDFRSLPRSTLRCLPGLVLGPISISLLGPHLAADRSCITPETARHSQLFLLYAPLANKRSKFICSLCLSPLFSLRRHNLSHTLTSTHTHYQHISPHRHLPHCIQAGSGNPTAQKTYIKHFSYRKLQTVSLLPFIAKTLKRVVFNQVSLFLSQNNKLDNKKIIIIIIQLFQNLHLSLYLSLLPLLACTYLNNA